MDFHTEIIDINDISKIKPLWEKLNIKHFEVSNNFKQHYEQQTFEKRCAKFSKLPKSCLRIEFTSNTQGIPVGYCICSIQNGNGELDSIYVEPQYRKLQIGSYLAQRGIEWMKNNGCSVISVEVADGNENVFPFYENLGFAVRKTVLQLK